MTTARSNPELNPEKKPYPHLCMSCMKEKGDLSICPHCQYDEMDVVSYPTYLKPRTLLRYNNEKYLVGENLGQGGFGITYVGFDTVLQKKVVVKEYFPSSFVTRDAAQKTVIAIKKEQQEIFADGIKQFLEEARNVAKFSNALHIVNVYDFFEENGTGYMVMEFLEGSDLDKHLKGQQGEMPVKEAIQTLFPVLEALRTVHSQHIYHRDISPQNIMITVEGRPVLIDFGAARQIIGEQSGSMDTVLKHGYSPFESYASRGKIGAWTDIYSCGAVLYRMITGDVPPPAPDRIEKDDVKIPSSCLQEEQGFTKPQLQQLDDAILCALAVKKEDRFKSIQAFKQALQQILNPKPTPPKPIPKPSPHDKKNRKTLWLIIITVLLFLTVGGVFSYEPIRIWIFPASDPTPTPVLTTPEPVPSPFVQPLIRSVMLKNLQGNIIHPLNETYYLQPQERVKIEVDGEGTFVDVDYHVIRGVMIAKHTYRAPETRGTRDIITIKLLGKTNKVLAQTVVKIKVIDTE